MKLLRDPLAAAWLALVALSGAATLLALRPGKAAGTAILLLGAIKARLILSRYMGLAQAPAWQRGFDLGLGLLAALLLALFLSA